MAGRKTRSRRNTSIDPATAYALSVVSGEHIEGPHVRAACARHLDDLKNGPKRGLRWNIEAAQHALDFFPDVLTVEQDGEVVPFVLLPEWEFVIGSIFGWQWRNGDKWFRRFNQAYIEAGKGSGKTPLCAGVGLYMMTADRELSAEVYAAAGKRDQAMRLFNDAVAMFQRSPDLQEIILPSGKKKIFKLQHPKTNSIFEPISADKQKSGARVHCGLVDELHEHKDRYTVDMLKHGFKGRKQPLEFVITNAGFDRNSICWEWHEHAVKVADRDRGDDRFFSFVMALDTKDDPLADPSCWEKTNPGIDITITRAYLEDQVNNARDIPGRENDVLRLNFCRWTDSDKGWMTRAAWEACEADLVTFKDGAAVAPDFQGAECYMGLDLSFAFDLSALAFLFPEDNRLVGWIEYFIPREMAAEGEKRDGQPYPLWIKQGLLTATAGKVIRLEHIGRRIADAQEQFDVRWIAYDKYRHKDLEDRMAEVGLSAPWIEHPQGFRRGGQLPFPQFRGEDGKAMDNPLWMPQSVIQLETRIIERTLQIQRSLITRTHVSSVVARPNPAGTGDRCFDKAKALGRIDGIVSLAECTGVAEMKLPKQSLAGFLNRPVMTK